MRARIEAFASSLPTRTDPRTASSIRASIGGLLTEGEIIHQHNPAYTSMQFISTEHKIERVEKAADFDAALRAERLDARVANFGEVEPGRLYRGSQPSRDGLRWLAQQGIKTVVTLRAPLVEDGYGYIDFTSGEEAEACRSSGLRSVNLPMPDMDIPSTAQVQAFLDIVNDPGMGPVYVHCAAGVGRTGVMCGVYERTRGASMDTVLSHMRLHDFDPDSAWGARQVKVVEDWPVASSQPDEREWLIAR